MSDFMGLFMDLGFHQGVEVLADTRKVYKPAAMNVAFAPKRDGFDFAFRNQAVERASFDTEQPLHILPTAEFRHNGGCSGFS
jgi:hypothetical protein